MAIHASAVYAILSSDARDAASAAPKHAPKPIARGSASARADRNWPRIAAIIVDWALFLLLLKIILDKLP